MEAPNEASKVLPKVNSRRTNLRLVIALHSSYARLETGLRECPPEKRQDSDGLRC